MFHIQHVYHTFDIFPACGKCISKIVPVVIVNIIHICFNIFINFLSPAIEFTSNEPAGDHQGDKMGRFELLIGEERDGSPVYQQVHSKEMPEKGEVLLFRWKNLNHYSFLLHQVWRRVAG